MIPLSDVWAVQPVSERTVRRWVADGRLHVVGGCVDVRQLSRVLAEKGRWRARIVA